MNDIIKIRASVTGSDTMVRVLMPHPMESGNRTDPSGARIPAHYISDVVVTHNKTPVLSAQFGPSVSRDPLITFRFNGGKAGDTIAVNWTDTQGVSRSAQSLIV